MEETEERCGGGVEEEEGEETVDSWVAKIRYMYILNIYIY